METLPQLEGGVSKGEPKDANGALLGTKMRVSMRSQMKEQLGTHYCYCSELNKRMGDPCLWEPILKGVSQQISWWTGVTPECVIRVNPFDTVVEVAAEVPIVAVAQQLHLVCKWEEIPVNVSCMMGKKECIMDMVR